LQFVQFSSENPREVWVWFQGGRSAF